MSGLPPDAGLKILVTRGHSSGVDPQVDIRRDVTCTQGQRSRAPVVSGSCVVAGGFDGLDVGQTRAPLDRSRSSATGTSDVTLGFVDMGLALSG